METPGHTYPDTDDHGRVLVLQRISRGTYGRYGVRGDAFDAPGPAGTVTKRHVKWPFPIDLVEGTVMLDGTMAGDTCRFVAAPDTDLNAVAGAPGPAIGILAAPIAVGDKQITLIPAVLTALVAVALIDSGAWELSFTDGVNSEGPFNVTGYDKATGVVTLGRPKQWTGASEPADWTGFANGYAADVNTVVTVTRVLVDDIELCDGTHPMTFGRAARGSAPLPADTDFCLVYTRSKASIARVRVTYDLLTGVVE